MSSTQTGEVIVIAAAIVPNSQGQLLHVRKRGTSAFMLPGGKKEIGESGVDTTRREIAEELGIELAAKELEFLGEFEAMAANEPGATVRCEVFIASRVCDSAQPQAEIVEVRWFDSNSQADELAPLSRDVVFPAYRTHCSTIRG